MAKLTEAKKREIAKAPTEQEKVKKAAAVMIETPMDLIRCILQRHEESVIEVMREQQQEIERLREGLKLITCEPINAEYMAQNILDGKPAYHDTMIKVGDGETAHNDRVEGRDAASSRRVPSHDGLCGNGNYNERTDK
jgi:hypothetical protein